jgi:hypothetical protein
MANTAFSLNQKNALSYRVFKTSYYRFLMIHESPPVQAALISDLFAADEVFALGLFRQTNRSVGEALVRPDLLTPR